MGGVENYRNVDFVSHFVKKIRLRCSQKDAGFLILECQGDSAEEDSE